MDPILARVDTADFCEMKETLVGWDHEYTQLDAGAFEGSLLFSQFDRLQISRNKWGRSIHYRGTSPEDTFGMALTLEQEGEARWMGTEASRNDVIIQKPGAEADYISAEKWDALVFTVPKQEMEQAIFDIYGDRPDIQSLLHGVVHFSQKTRDRLCRLGLGYCKVLEGSIQQSAASERLAPLARSMTHILIAELVRDIGLKSEKPSICRAREIVRFAEDYAKKPESHPIKMGTICRELGISERAFYYAFTQTVDMTPANWLRIHKLNRAHTDLRKSDPKNNLVHQIAFRNGFIHMGNFGQNYRRLFGETPSCTLQR
jgi:AraC family ethanolamine operon transcriptional activator